MHDFEASKVDNMNFAFYNCESIISLNFNNFNTSKIRDMSYLFYNCKSLKYLNISNFDTNQVKNMEFMFYNCFSLTSLNISNFKTEKVENMDGMFYNCSLLSTLDLSNFSGNNVNNLFEMFAQCSSLIILNLSNFNTQNLLNMDSMFSGCSKLKYVNFSKVNEKQLSSLSNIFDGIRDNFIICFNKNININLSSIVLNKPTWSINCSEDICTHYHYYDSSNEIFFTDSDQCPKEYKNLILEEKECINNCTKKNNFEYEFRNRCYPSCPEISGFELTIKDTNIYKCEIKCTKNNPFEIVAKQECKEKCTIGELKEKSCILNYQGENKENIMLNNMLDDLSNNNFNKNILDNNNPSIKLNVGQTSFIITNSKSIEENGFIQLGECEIELRRYNNIAENDLLYLFIINTFQNETRKNKTVFEVYHQTQNSQLKKLDLSICENIINNSITNCSIYSIESILEDSCINCKDDYYPIYNNEFLNDNPFKNCYKNLEGFYLSQSDKAYKKCFHTCEICSEGGDEENHYCDICKNNYIYEMLIPPNYLNCYKNCLNYTYDKERDKYICFENPKCSKTNEKYIPDTKECILDCKNSSIYKYEFKKVCYKECPVGTEKSKDREFSCDKICSEDYPYLHIRSQECIKDCSLEEIFTKICKINYKDANNTQIEKLKNKIIEEILNGNLGPLLSEILYGNSTYMIENENDAHFISTIKGQLSTINFSSVDFGECEKYLRNVSRIGNDEELIMYKIEHYVEGFNIPIIEYMLFTQDGRIRLNLSLCEDMKIQFIYL